MAPHCQDTSDCEQQAQRAAQRALRAGHPRAAAREWSRCAALATKAMVHRAPVQHTASRSFPSSMVTRCSDGLLSVLAGRRGHVVDADTLIGAGIALPVEWRAVSPHLRAPIRLIRAVDVGGPTQAPDGGGFGVPLALFSPRCDDQPICDLLPPEGVFRAATGWLDVDQGGALRLVVAEPAQMATTMIDGRPLTLAADHAAFYRWGTRRSPLTRLSRVGLFGGREIERRSGLYLLEDYDPDKQPLVMIHGLASSPLIWAGLSQAVWRDPALRTRFQVWHLVYPTHAPQLVLRRRLAAHLDHAWQVLDPDGDDAARHGMVLVGHSLGGVLARLLATDSDDTLWDSAFTAAPDTLMGSQDDLAVVQELFRFRAYPGIRRSVFLAAPHRGSPLTHAWFGRMIRRLVHGHVPELDALQRIARDQPGAIHDAVRDRYLDARVNSITTLQPDQIVRAAAETLLPDPAIQLHTIAGVLSGRKSVGDGIVPLASALLPGAASTLLVDIGHSLTEDARVIDEVLRILHEEIAPPPGPLPACPQRQNTVEPTPITPCLATKSIRNWSCCWRDTTLQAGEVEHRADVVRIGFAHRGQTARTLVDRWQ